MVKFSKMVKLKQQGSPISAKAVPNLMILSDNTRMFNRAVRPREDTIKIFSKKGF